MNLTKKFIGLFLLMMFAVVFVGCNKSTTEAPTTQAPTTQAPTTNGPTTVAPTTGDTTTTEDPGTDTVPQFVGLFPKQTVYKGSAAYDILAGAKAIDAEDGELEIMTAGAYSTTRVGTYEVYAYAQDSDGNVITELITLTVKDLSGFTIPTVLTTDDISINLWHSNGATVESALIKYATEFMALYPNITVSIEKNGNNYDELRENMVNAIRGGSIPNIVQNYPDHVMEYIDNDGVIPLTPYIFNPTWGYDAADPDEAFLDILLSYRRENSQYTNDGEYYSIPFNKSTEVMIYNKTMFDMLIADGIIDEVPNTWQGLFEVAPYLYQIKDEVIDDITARLNHASAPLSFNKTPEQIQAIKDNFVPITYDSPANAFITLTRQWGGEYTDIDAARNGVIKFDNPQTREMLSYFFDNRDNPFTLPGKWGTEYASDAFKLGQTAVTFGSTGGARYNTPNIVADVSDLFISEYVEGSSNNKYIEIYNGTGKEVDLSNYSVNLYSDGSSTPTQTQALTGTLAHNKVYIIAHSSANATILNKANLVLGDSSIASWDGNDALALLKNGSIIDLLGTIGDNADFAKDVTLVRNKTILDPSATYNNSEWNQYAVDTFDNIGTHVVRGDFVFEFGVMPMPYNEDMPENRTAIQQGTNMSITTAGTDQQKLASWLFLKYLTSKAVQLDFALTTGYSPVRYSVYDLPEYDQFRLGLDSSGNALYGEDLMKSFAGNAAAQQSDFLFYDQAFIGSSTARAEVELAFERVILGSLEGTTKQDIIDDAIAAAVANSERVLT